jgi:APA family basic amino acid/polyamine antiporter
MGGLKVHYAELVSIVLILLLTYINTRGIESGKWIQTIFTVTKLLSLFGLIVFGFFLGAHREIWAANWTDAWHMHSLTVSQGGETVTGGHPIVGLAVLGAIAAAMTGSIFSSDAWNNVTFIAGEMKNPKRNIGLSLFLGTLIITLIYVLANLMYISVLPLHQIATSPQDRVAVAAANVIFGHAGTYVVAAMIMVSTFGCNNGLILAGARVYYTMAHDGLFLKEAGRLNRHAVPGWALWAQCLVASLLCLSGKYSDLLVMISFVAVAFYALTVIGIFVLRKREPDMDRPYKAFGYPVLPAIYVILALIFCVALIIQKPLYSTWGLGIVLAGIPIYYMAVSRRRADLAAAPAAGSDKT